jgi:hypothetical protein
MDRYFTPPFRCEDPLTRVYANYYSKEGMTDVLPAIQKLFVSGSLPVGPVRDAIEQFVAARGLPAFEKPAFSEWRFSVPMSDERSLLSIVSVSHFNSSLPFLFFLIL